MVLGLGCRLPGLRISYTLRNPCQPCAVIMQCASSTLLATPAIPPAAWTASSHCCCSGLQPAGCGLHLNAGEHCHGAADHLWRYRDALPADQVSAALAETKLHRSAIGITQRAGVIAEQAHRVTVDCRRYGSLAEWFAQMPRLSCSTGAGSVTVPHWSAIASATPIYVRLRSFQRSGPGGISSTRSSRPSTQLVGLSRGKL
jgi:hypothetical protein